MEKIPFKKISESDWKGWLRADIADFLPPLFFRDPVLAVQKAGGRVVKESRLRWAAVFNLPEEQRVFIKRDKTKGWAEALKYLLVPSKGRKEWFIAYQLRKRALPVPRPLGWMERAHRGFVTESYYFSEAIGPGTSLMDTLESSGEIPIEPLAKAVKGFHDAGLFHKDLHAGNFLWDGESFFLTDLHRAEIVRSLSLEQRLWSLSQIFHSLRFQERKSDLVRFLDVYFAADPLYPRVKETYIQKILSSMEDLRKRWWKSRTKRCLKKSTEFSVERMEEMTVYHRRDFPLDRIKEVVDRHEMIIRDRPSDLLKHAPESIVSLVNGEEGTICVKQFRHPRSAGRLKDLFRKSKGLKAWVAGNGLKVRDLPSLSVMACAEKKDAFGRKESYLLMEASEQGTEMDRFLLRGFEGFRRRRLFIKAFARWISGLHQRDLYHRDMKTCNIVVSEEEGGWKFRLLDLEDVRLDRKVGEKDLFDNLLQINTSVPRGITLTDRLRFYREYNRLRPVVRDEKDFLFKLVQKSRERGIVYVSPRGVVEEKWS